MPNFASGFKTGNTPASALNFRNNAIYNVGGNGGYPVGNPGLGGFTGLATDIGKFRAPSLKNIAVTTPYFHDGSAATLDDVIDSYAAGGRTARRKNNVHFGADAEAPVACDGERRRTRRFASREHFRNDLWGSRQAVDVRTRRGEPRWASAECDSGEVDRVRRVDAVEVVEALPEDGVDTVQGRAQTAALAAERDEVLFATGAADDAHEAVLEDAATQVVLELALDVAWQAAGMGIIASEALAQGAERGGDQAMQCAGLGRATSVAAWLLVTQTHEQR